MKLFLLLLASLAAFCQDVTNDIYWAAQPPALQALRSESDEVSKAKLAESLAKDGYKIDVPIMVWGWDALKAMKLRADFGYTWVPSALQPNIQIAPGLVMYGMIPYDPDNPPPGSIKVSLKAEDYPAFVKPAEKPQQITESPVGPQSIGSLYLTTVGDKYPAGSVVNEPRGKFIKRISLTPFGSQAFWEKL